MNTTDKIIEIFRDRADFPADKELSLDKDFKELGIDSMDLVEVIFAIEEEFSIEIPDTDLANFKTVSSAVDFVEKLIK
ncbi:MAG: acyl carrier protein [Clostridiales bacterium]